jgi:hypothetical protein
MARKRKGKSSFAARREREQRKFYIPVSNGRTVFAEGTPDGMQTYAFTNRADGEFYIHHNGEFLTARHGLDNLTLTTVPGNDFLGGLLIKLPDQGIDVINLDYTGLPLTEKGALWLSQDHDRPLAPKALPPEEWAKHLEAGTWKKAWVLLLIELLGGDTSDVNWDSPEETAQKLDKLWKQFTGYGRGKAALPWE